MKQLPDETMLIVGVFMLAPFAFIALILTIFVHQPSVNNECKNEVKYDPKSNSSYYYKCGGNK